ncbi:protein of unknown function DUF1028 [Caldithrix abyssi DSM 13497]|uniref:Putative conserved protein, Ntn-hydrolase superfamily n=1 Tax=Caldithrix abyssi DSM 13497 TaxID=880073 RepID=H1XQL8_CALAY|nr:DUF1028 domain-containing protein [Caldithrix abyssi]APF17010.1 putative conserved protein, Ntn-hydrolase superfamily [Caldithrix abyssi DSM 13497]EHO41164.1 protein of unknown function DUF1028 [Caldithrix abyssi DSM 13497]
MKRIFASSVLIILIFTLTLPGQTINGEPLTHTFSIVAIDQENGEMGVAVQSHWFSVGSIVAWAEAGVGVVATQSLVNVSFGPRGLELMKAGKSPQQALDELLSSDPGAAYRQVALLDAQGRVAAHTGDKCIADAGHIIGEGFSVQANMMLNKKVVPAMEKAFKNSKGPLAERLMAAMKAAQEAGGDIRGQQSAAIKIVKIKASGKPWEDTVLDLRVEDHPQAVAEMERILKVFRAYEHMNKGDLAIEKGDVQTALREYGAAEAMFPQNEEMKYWHAVSLANIGEIEASLPLFKEVFQKTPEYKELTRRIVPNGLLKVNQQQLEIILNVK